MQAPTMDVHIKSCLRARGVDHGRKRAPAGLSLLGS